MTQSRLIETLLDQKGPDWIASVLEPFVSQSRMARIDQVLAHRLTRLTVGLVRLYDPHNGAAVIRTAEAMGLSALHAAEAEGQPFRVSPKVTIGCEKWISVERHPSTAAMAKRLHDQGFRLWAAVVDGKRDVTQIPLEGRVALIFGNERDGLSEEDQSHCDETFRLPMWGFTQSYNLSVSVGMTLMALVPRLRENLPQSGDLTQRELERMRARWMARSVKAADAILKRALAEQQVSHTDDPTTTEPSEARNS